MAPLTVQQHSDVDPADREKYIDLLEKASRIVEQTESDMETEDETDFLGESTYGPAFLSYRRVSFAVAIKKHEVINLEEYSEKELRKCWYSAEEKQKIHAKKDKIVERIEKSRSAKKGMTYRGLDCWTTAGGSQLDTNIAKVIDAVMDEQEAQWSLNADDHDRLARVSQAASDGALDVARAIALDDERESQIAWQERQDQASVEEDEEDKSCSDDEAISTSIHLKAREREARRAAKREAKRAERKRKNSRRKKLRKHSTRSQASDPPGKKIGIGRNPSETSKDILQKMRMASRSSRKGKGKR